MKRNRDKPIKTVKHQRVLDHKIPLDKFGNNEHYNIWLLCHPCDRAKKNKLIEPCVQQHIENRVDYLKKKFKLS